MPDIITEPRPASSTWKIEERFGNWIDKTIYTCPKCGAYEVDLKHANYCPNCGAYMRGRGDGHGTP